MAGDTRVEARGAQAWDEARQVALPPLDCVLAKGDCLFMLAEDMELAGSYLRMLAAVVRPEYGEMRFFGQAEAGMDEEVWQALRRKIGYVDHAIPLLSVLSGIDNVKLPARYHRLGDEEAIGRRARELLEAIDYRADHAVLPAYMSELQRRHLSIVRALMLEPQLLFLNDPFAGLGSTQQRMIAEFLLGQVRQGRIGLLLSTDNPQLVHEYAGAVLFCSEQAMLLFDSWQQFHDSTNEQVRDYIGQQRRRCDIFN